VIGPIGLVCIIIGYYLFFGRRLFHEPELSHYPPPEVDQSLMRGREEGMESFSLMAEAIERTQVEVKVDTGQLQSVLLEKGSQKDWTADESIYIELTSPQRVELYLNGRLLERDQKRDQKVALRINAQGIVDEEVVEQIDSVPDDSPIPPPVTLPVPVLVGLIQEEELFKKMPVYESRKRDYQPDSLVVQHIHEMDPSLTLTCFFGTWDDLSGRVIPYLLRVLELARLSDVSIDLIGVDKELKDRTKIVEVHHIQGIPTILIFSRGQELGRIAGQPSGSIESEIYSILEQTRHL
jgi:hypothetical protein